MSQQWSDDAQDTQEQDTQEQDALELGAQERDALANEGVIEAAEVTVEDETPEVTVEDDDVDPADPVQAFKDELAAKYGDWYVVHSYAGYENRVKANLETRMISLNMEDYIFEVQVPMESVTEIKSGQKKLVNRVRMPGYVLVRMELTDESWGAVRHTPGVTGFVGNAHAPVPLSLDEVYSMLKPADLEAPKAGAAGGQAGSSSAGGRSTIVDFEVGSPTT